MRAQKKFLPYLYLFFGTLLPLLLFILLFDPTGSITLFQVEIGYPLFLFLILLASFFFLFTFVFANRRRGLLASLFVVGILVLRFFGLRSIFQTAILLIIILLIEYLYSIRYKTSPRKTGIVKDLKGQLDN
ncbi:MAG TPA: hypothetical protein VG965_01155 [Patescibacteria group bacterium]|nr:hypothetical protein [Patescibacteria group bacterium]